MTLSIAILILLVLVGIFSWWNRQSEVPTLTLPPGEGPGQDESPGEGRRGGDVESLYRMAAELNGFFQQTAQASDLLDHGPFREAVAFVDRQAFTDDELLGYARGDNLIVACICLEAMAGRTGPWALHEELLRSLNDYHYWTRFFMLRTLDRRSRADEKLIPEVLVRLDGSWEHPAALQVLREFLRERSARDEEPSLGDSLDRLSAETAEILDRAIPFFESRHAAALRAELDLWRARHIDTGLFESIGRLRRAEDEQGGTIVEDEMLRARVRDLHRCLTETPRRSVLLVGEAGVGKTTALRALSRRLHEEGWTVFEAGHVELLAGQSFVGQLEERVGRLMTALGGGRRVLWVIPAFHELLTAGRHRHGRTGIIEMILPAIESGQILVAGETEPTPFERLVQEKPRCLTALESFRVNPLSEEDTLELAQRWAREPSQGAGAAVADPETIREAWELADQYLSAEAPPGNLLGFLRSAREAALRGAPPDAAPLIETRHLIAALGRLTGLPASILDENETLDLSELRDHFGGRVMGQEEAVACLVDRVAMMKAGLTDPTRPQGVFLFAGPTGTGKTEIAKTLAEFLFGSPDRMIRLDMSEFQTPDSLPRIVGEPERGTGDALVDRIREQPFSLVLLDEFEKAHANVWDLFLQVFDDGRLTNHAGKTVDFRHSIIILTSNLGAVVGGGPGVGFTGEGSAFRSESVHKAIGQAFRKEFLNRLDRVIVFRPLSRETMRAILRKELDDVLQRRGLRTRSWTLEWDESAIEFLLDRGFTFDLGARPLKRAIERYLLGPLATTIVDLDYPTGDQFLLVHSDRQKLVVDFIDPDAPEGPEAEREEPEAIADLGLTRLVLEASGSAEEIAFLRSRYASLLATVDSRPWQEAKSEALALTGHEGFWNRPDRYRVLGLAEYRDRIERNLAALDSFLARLEGSPERQRRRLPREPVRTLAQRIFLLELACEDLALGRPREAFLCLQASRAPGVGAAEAERFARRLGEMYRSWARLRRMNLGELKEETPEGPGSYLLLLSVSGFAAYTLLAPEDGFHVEEVSGRHGHPEKRARARVRVLPQPDEPEADGPAGLCRQAEKGLGEAGEPSVSVVRIYRESPSPLVRDTVRGWRTGRLDRVLAGEFDVIQEKVRQS